MVTNSPMTGTPIPEMIDTININTAVGNISSHIDSYLIPRFSSLTERNSKIPSPDPGTMCYVSATGELYVFKRKPYNTWVSAIGRAVFKTSSQATSSGFVSDNELFFSVEANSTYFGKLDLNFDAGTTTDGLLTWSEPTGTLIRSTFHNKVAWTNTSNTVDNIDAFTFWATQSITVGTVTSDLVPFSSSLWIDTSNTSGTCTLRFSNANSGTFTMNPGSNIMIWKVA